MFKKYSRGRGLLEKEVAPAHAPSHAHDPSHAQDLPHRPHSPFSTDLMNSFATTSEAEEEEPETVIASQVHIKGTLSFQKLLRIDGTFEGELVSTGKLIVGPTGSVTAHIHLQEAYISGKVVGDITVTTRLSLRGRAEVRGNIVAPLISVDEGVSIIGQLNVSSDKTEHTDL